MPECGEARGPDLNPRRRRELRKVRPQLIVQSQELLNARTTGVVPQTTRPKAAPSR